jgi:excisionase family DNA binding protein
MDNKKKNPTNPAQDCLLRVAEAAQLLNVDPSTIYKWVDEGRIPYVNFGQPGRRCLRFNRKDLEAFIKRNSRGIGGDETAPDSCYKSIEESGCQPAEGR